MLQCKQAEVWRRRLLPHLSHKLRTPVNITSFARRVLNILKLHEIAVSVEQQQEKCRLNEAAITFASTIVDWIIEDRYVVYNRGYYKREFSECLVYLLDWIMDHHKYHTDFIAKKIQHNPNTTSAILEAMSIVYPDRVYLCYK